MAVTVSNLIQGPGTLYIGTYSSTGANEPADAAINSSPSATAWTDLGGTTDGVNFEFGREFSELEVDQLIDLPESRQTKRRFTVATNLAEVTLENLARVMNEVPGTQVVSSGSTKVYTPALGSALFIPTYVALIFDGYAPGGFRRRVICRKMLSVDPPTLAYKKDGQAVYATKFAGHYISDSVLPYKVVDQTA